VIEHYLEKLENALGCWGAGVVLGLFTLAIAAVYVTPAIGCVNHGCAFQDLSSAPFAFASDNAVKGRFLTPALAYFALLRGRFYIVLPLLVMVLLLASIYWMYRRNMKFARASALLVMLAIGFSTPVLFLLHFAGYVDVTSYLFIFLAILLIDSRFAAFWPLLFGLAVLNHESSALIAPFLLGLSAVKRGWLALLLDALLVGTCLLGLLFLSRYIHSQGYPGFTLSFYLSVGRMHGAFESIAKMLPIGVFMSFKLFWCLPLIAIVIRLRRRDYKTSVLIALPILGALAQLLVAEDTSRLLGLSFPSILLACSVLRDEWGEPVFSKRLLVIFLWNLLVPQYYVGQERIVPMIPLPISLATWLLFDVDPWTLWWG
jgi:hypothetical protein